MNILAVVVVVTNVGFTVGFDTETRNPAWVAYDLEPHEVVKAERKAHRFAPDPRVSMPDAIGQTLAYDLAADVGWDRGHMAPAADFNWNTNALRQTYYFSNVVPMARHVNRGEWRRTEDEVRRLAASGMVHVVAFPVYRQGVRSSNTSEWPDVRITFPDRLVKVAYGYFGVRMWTVENKRNGRDVGSDEK